MKDLSMKSKKIIMAVIVVVFVAVVLIMGTYLTMKDSNGDFLNGLFNWHTESETETEAPETTAVTEPEEEYISPKDFQELKDGINPDIYAWIHIPDTIVDQPVLQYAESADFYLDHDIYGNYDPTGCLYTQYYNTRTFNDKVTVIYGHNLVYKQMFNELINYSDKAYFDEHNTMTVYLPNEEKHYSLVAAIPFDNRHLLYHWDFSVKEEFDAFFADALSRPNAVVADGVEVSSDDRIVVLSTCYYTIEEMRYLVIWKEIVD